LFSSKRSPDFLTRFPVFYGWVILVVVSLAIFVSGPGQTYTISIFVEPIIEEMGWSRTLISTLYTAGSLAAATAMIFVGRLLDRYGARSMLFIICVLFGFAALWMSRINRPSDLFWGFLALRTLGQGSLTLIPTTLLALWFVRQRGRVTALAGLGGAASLAIIPPVAHIIILNFGWRDTWVVFAFAIWGLLLIPVVALVRRSPESVGLRPDGDPPSHESYEQDSELLSQDELDWTPKEAMRTRSFWLLLFTGSSQSLISTALVFHQVSLFNSKGLDASLAAVTLTVMAISNVLGNLLAGFLVDKFPNRYVLASAQLVTIVAMLSIFTISQPWHAFVYVGTLGLGNGLFMNATTVIWPNYFGRKYLGSIRGIATASMVAFAAMGPMPFGILYDRTGNYTSAIIIFLLLPAACTLAAFFATRPEKVLLTRGSE
jgi:MFS family permease